MINIPREVQISEGIQSVQPVSLQEKAQLFNDMAKETQTFVSDMQQKAQTNDRLDFENYATTQTREIYEQNKLNPTALKKEYDALFSGLSKNATGEEFKAYRNYFDNVSNSYIQKATNNYNRKQEDDLKINTMTAYNEELKKLDDLAPNALIGTSEQRYNAGLAIADSINRVKNLTSQVNSEGQYIFSAEQIATSADKAKGVLISSGVNQAFELAQDKEDFLRRFKAGEVNFDIPTEDGGSVQINTKHELKDLDYSRLENSMLGTIKQEREAQEKMQGDLLANQAARGLTTIDPTTTDNKKNLDRYFGTLSQEIATLPQDQQVMKIVEFTNNTGYVPTQLMTGIKASVMNGNNEQAIRAAGLVNAIRINSPKTSWQLDDESMRESINMAYDLEAGLSQEDVIKNRDLRRNLNPDQKKFLDTKLKEDTKDIDFANMARNSLDTTFRLEPKEAPLISETSKLADDYRRLYNNNYILSNGNTNAAESIANEQFKRLYGVSEAGYGGRAIMRFAPETYYHLDDLPDYNIKKDIKSFVGNKIKSSEDAFLVSDVKTEMESKSLRPSYMVMKENENGMIEPVFGDNNLPMRFTPRVEEHIKNLGVKHLEYKKNKMESAAKKREVKKLMEQSTTWEDGLSEPFYKDYIK